MLEEKYKAKVEAMQIYVPLLTKLITKLETKNDESEDTIEKIGQLKILLKQLLDPKPGISFEELNECHEVMENLFKSNNNDAFKIKLQSAQTHALKKKQSSEEISSQLKDSISSGREEHLLKATTQHNKEQKIMQAKQELKEQTDQLSEEKTVTKNLHNKDRSRKSQQAFAQSADKFNKDIKVGEDEKELVDKHCDSKDIETKAKIVLDEVENMITLTHTKVKAVGEEIETYRESETEIVFDGELENVEQIEFPEEGDESFEDEEIILPDNDGKLFFVDPGDIKSENENKKNANYEEDLEEKNEKSENNNKMEEKIEIKNKKQTNEMRDLCEEWEDNEIDVKCEKENNKCENKAEKGGESNIKNMEFKNPMEPQAEHIYSKSLNDKISDSSETSLLDDETLLEEDEHLMDLNVLHQKTTKRDSSQLNADGASKSKKARIWDPVNDIEIEAAMQTVNALADGFLDPLAVDELNLEQLSKNIRLPSKVEKEKVTIECNRYDNGDDDNDDDIEIIESRNSPIIIDSDDEDLTITNFGQINKPEEEIIKPKPTFVPKKTFQEQFTHNIVISNVISLNQVSSNKSTVTRTLTESLKNNSKASPKHIIINKTGKLIKVLPQKKLSAPSTITSEKQLHNGNNLQPKMISDSNPQLFSTKVGNRTLLIPNAFYGNSKKVVSTNSNKSHFSNSSQVPSTNPDIAHCRWLENFLRHFCSPYNIAHNTCFMLLQRSLREEDYERIRQMRLETNVAKGEIDEELLESLRMIFYVDCADKGDPFAKRLSFVGRKFCNLAFVNILDKTISLTVDWRTNGVTSRTRISAATLEALDKQTTTTTSTVPTIATATKAIVYPSPAKVNIKPTAQFSTVKTFIPVQQLPKLSPTQHPKQDSLCFPATITNIKNATATETHALNYKNSIKYPNNEMTAKFERIVQETSVSETTPRHSSRKENRRADKIEITNSFIYSDEDNDVDTENDGTDQEFFPEKENCKSSSSGSSSPLNKDADVSTFVKKIGLKKNFMTEKMAPEKKTSTFESAFLELLAHQEKGTCVRVKQKGLSTAQSPMGKEQSSVLLRDDKDIKVALTATKKLTPSHYDHEVKVCNINARDKRPVIATTKKLPLEPRLITKEAAHEDQIMVLLDDDNDVEVTQPAPTKLLLEPRLIKNKRPYKGQTIALLDEDNPTKLPLEPRLITNERTQREKNVSANVHLNGKYANFCLVCKRKVNHIVGHYVNMHPDCEVYTSRPTPAFAVLLLQNQMEIAQYHRDQKSMSLFLATCVFCEKRGSFTISYWYQHFVSHTGEYAYQCTGCGIRKPSRAQVVSHLSNCTQNGEVETIHEYDCLVSEIKAYMCRLCNYTQMNHANVMKHLICEHGFDSAEKQYCIGVTLLHIPHKYARVSTNKDYSAKSIQTKSSKNDTKTAASQISNQSQNTASIIIRNSNGDVFEISEISNGKSYAVDLTNFIDQQATPMSKEDASYTYCNQMDEIKTEDVEQII